MKEFEDIEKLFDEMNKEMAELKKVYQKRAQEVFKTAFKQFFESNPEANVVGWSQYTPYFNDGDACIFQSKAAYAFVSNAKDYENISYGSYDGDDESVWVDDPDYGDYYEEAIPKSTVVHAAILRRMLGKIDDTVFLEMFGDHVKVFATREGFDVQEYDHD